MRFLKQWKNMLWVQLGLAIFAVNLAVLGVGFIFQYEQLEEILLENSEQSSIERFEQAEKNIKGVYEQANRVLTELVLDKDLLNLSDVNKMSDADRAAATMKVLQNFSEIRERYPEISAISYYGNDGYIMQCSESLRIVRYDEKLEDWYYTSGVFQNESRSRKMYWEGGYTSADFDLSKDENETDAQYYISLGKNAGGANRKLTGKVILHYDMEYFWDLFASAEKEQDVNVYIIDENNRIMAAGDNALIGTERIFREDASEEERIELYIEDSEEGKRQVIVYQLADVGWKLVNERLVSEVTKGNRTMRNIMLLTCLFSVVTSFVLSMVWFSNSLKPLNRVVTAMQKVGKGDLGTTVSEFPKNEIGILASEFNRMSLKLKDMFERNRRIEKEKRDFEMKSLRAQINPHLIYNTLNTIKWMAIIKKERGIAKSIVLLSDFLEPIFREKSQMCTVKEELDYLEKYVEIMNLRNGERYRLELNVPQECYSYQMIRFLLQPVVENAILHGFEGKNTGVISIAMRIEGKDVIIRVEDDGMGIETEQLNKLRRELEKGERKKDGIGLTNVNRRIKVYYGEDYGIALDGGEECGFVATIRIRLELSGHMK